MTKFSIGDRVEFQATTPDTSYTPYGDGDAPTHLNGSRGTIISDEVSGIIRVNWDEGSAARRAYETTGFSRDGSYAASFTANLVLVTEPARIPVGTRAKALSGQFKGATGEITNDDGTSLWEYTLRFDTPRGSGGVRQEIYSKHELEVLPSDDTKPITEGDRVEWLGFVKRNNGETDRPVGTLGTVDWVPPFNKGTETDTVHVRWDGDGAVRGTWLVNIKHAAEPTTPAITPESLRDQAAAKRAEAADLAKQELALRDMRAALHSDAKALDDAAQTIERLATP